MLAAAPNREDYLKLVSARESGPRVTRTAYESDMEEAQGVAARIARLVANGAKPSDCAILTRINAQQPVFGAALRAARLKYRVRKDSGWQSSALADDAASKRALLEAMGLDATGLAANDDLGVTISTIHASKGLEFKHVFLIGCSCRMVRRKRGMRWKRNAGLCMWASPELRIRCICRMHGPRMVMERSADAHHDFCDGRL